MGWTIEDYITAVDTGAKDPQTIIQDYMDRAAADDDTVWVALHEKYVEEQMAPAITQTYHGLPLGLKDNILTAGQLTTCGSQMLADYIPPYDATVVEKLQQAGCVIMGKTNMDEFAMGASTEHSAYGVTTNPFALSRVAGGSSGGSAAAVAKDQCIVALGTDTGGSIRQPAAFCGVVGLKPTYGKVSRYGVQSMASSLDQVGTFTKTVRDAAHLLDIISGHDDKDATSQPGGDEQASCLAALGTTSLKGAKIALPQQFISDSMPADIQDLLHRTYRLIEQQGATIEQVDIPLLSYVVPVYYILVPAEVSTNMARFDGIRFGKQDDTTAYNSIFAYYEHMRSTGFGDEVKRRILTGSYVLSAGHYDAYYHKALAIKQHLTHQFAELLRNYDAIIGPTTPDVAWEIGAKGDEPVQMYLEDIYTCGANITGVPAISLPIGMVTRGEDRLPFGLQLMGAHRGEGALLSLAEQIEELVAFPRADEQLAR